MTKSELINLISEYSIEQLEEKPETNYEDEMVKLTILVNDNLLREKNNGN